MAEIPEELTGLYPQVFASPLPGAPGQWYVADRPGGSIVGMGQSEAEAIANALAAASSLGITTAIRTTRTFENAHREVSA